VRPAGSTRPAAVGVPEAAAAGLAAFVLVPLVGGPLQAAMPHLGLAATEVVCVLCPALAVLLLTGAAPAEALGWRRLPPRALLGALLVALGGFYLAAAGVEGIQERLAPLPPALREQMRRFILPQSGPRPLAADLVALALLPALCEELLFRGLLLSSLLPTSRGLALLATSLAFGAFHYSVYKFLPTAALGLILGLVALRARSTRASVVVHALNNTLVVLLVRAGLDDPPGAVGPWLPLLLLGAAVLVWLGLRLCDPRYAPAS
jgi:sodium transport system permease protein